MCTASREREIESESSRNNGEIIKTILHTGLVGDRVGLGGMVVVFQRILEGCNNDGSEILGRRNSRHLASPLINLRVVPWDAKAPNVRISKVMWDRSL